jgi:molybdenum-dependent DNA-binding transcriptional regulator ModE
VPFVPSTVYRVGQSCSTGTKFGLLPIDLDTHREQDMLDLRRLRYFVAIDRCGSMLLASRQLGIAQPALSRHMRELEALVGFQLLERLPRGVRTTDAGQILLHHAKLIVAQVDEAEGAIRSFAKAKGGMRTVKLSLLPSWSTSFTPAITFCSKLSKRGMRSPFA